MMKLQDHLWNMAKAPKVADVELEADRDLHSLKGQRFLEDVVTQIGRDSKELVAFAYELRKQDVTDRYSYEFLNGQVAPALLVDVLMANQWDTNSDRMTVNSGSAFKLFVGKGNSLYCPKNSTEGTRRPCISQKAQADCSTALTFLLDPIGFQIQCEGTSLVSLGGEVGQNES